MRARRHTIVCTLLLASDQLLLAENENEMQCSLPCYTCLFTAVIYGYQRQCLSCGILRNVGATHTAVAVLLHIPVLYNKEQVGPKNLEYERLHCLVTRGWTINENIKWKKRSQSKLKLYKLMTVQTHKHMEMKHGLRAGVYLVGGWQQCGSKGREIG
jgi:hypothetical protein